MMEKKISRLLGCLKVEYSLMWIIVLAAVVLYESDVIPQGMWVDNARMAYLVQVLGVLMTVGVIPLSFYMFKVLLTRHVRRLSFLKALESYHRWSGVRLVLLLVPLLLDLFVYYSTLDTAGLLCAAMMILASLFCMPSRKRLLAELDLENPENV